ncbi:hypothetical protein AZI85_13285 [Bdellovibrio bacteriovorus]|uniref:Uncharacterized protein n=1 Tax=Bdellovibrio bacteriovorus TaxID=959 RepID=A0A150WBN8_BDEBC|nr:hypothetical protein [Bdellovibrio bacteriovorus]KYG60435.1 hypothetical protein AZI85_13285 [Bdellovibrio bacteriovorus]
MKTWILLGTFLMMILSGCGAVDAEFFGPSEKVKLDPRNVTGFAATPYNVAYTADGEYWIEGSGGALVGEVRVESTSHRISVSRQGTMMSLRRPAAFHAMAP